MNLEPIKQKLIEDGFRVQTRENGSLVFKFEGMTYYIDTDIKDENYIRIGLPDFWTLSGTDDRLRALQMANDVTESMKGVKVFLIGDEVSCTIEQFVPDANAVLAVLPRYLGAIQSAARTYAEKFTNVSVIAA
ncbi:hypothetical protein [Duganella sp.]|uniref:hypothetical protein n=1 Tax=Duganella sp. TaxID=1904440 RepID=UPI0031D85AF2